MVETNGVWKDHSEFTCFVCGLEAVAHIHNAHLLFLLCVLIRSIHSRGLSMQLTCASTDV